MIYKPKYIYRLSDFSKQEQDIVTKIEDWCFESIYKKKMNSCIFPHYFVPILRWNDYGVDFIPTRNTFFIGLNEILSKDYYCYYDLNTENIMYDMLLEKLKDNLKFITYYDLFKLAIINEIIS